MKMLVVVFAILLYPVLSYGSEDPFKWTPTDTALEVVVLTTLDIDRAQTVEFTKHPRPKANEEVGWAKHFTGRHPSVHQINNYFIASALLHGAIAYALPNPYRKIWQGTWIIVETNTIKNNISVGVGVRF